MKPLPAILLAFLTLGCLAHAEAQTTAPTAPPSPAASAPPLSPDTPVQTPPNGEKASWWSNFRDPNDHDLDMSSWLLKHKGALLVPIIITEPAVGNGGGVAAVW